MDTLFTDGRWHAFSVAKVPLVIVSSDKTAPRVYPSCTAGHHTSPPCGPVQALPSPTPKGSCLRPLLTSSSATSSSARPPFALALASVSASLPRSASASAAAAVARADCPASAAPN